MVHARHILRNDPITAIMNPRIHTNVAKIRRIVTKLLHPFVSFHPGDVRRIAAFGERMKGVSKCPYYVKVTRDCHSVMRASGKVVGRIGRALLVCVGGWMTGTGGVVGGSGRATLIPVLEVWKD